MKLFYALPSPFARKVRVIAQEVGLSGEVELIDSMTFPNDPNPELSRVNPTRKLPALVTEEGRLIVDSRVICAYLIARSGRDDLLPSSETRRFTVLTLEALGDALMDASVLLRYELALRPEEFHWSGWIEGQKGKVDSLLDALESDWIEEIEGQFTLGSTSVGCALGYLDFRFSDWGWRDSHPRLAAWGESFESRPSAEETKPA